MLSYRQRLSRRCTRQSFICASSVRTLIRPVVTTSHVFSHRHAAESLRWRHVPQLLLLLAMARHSALAACLACLVGRPFVRRALLVRGSATLAGDLALFVPIHRREAAILFGHRTLLPWVILAPGLLRTCVGRA